jgi:hypothetical protein
MGLFPVLNYLGITIKGRRCDICTWESDTEAEFEGNTGASSGFSTGFLGVFRTGAVFAALVFFAVPVRGVLAAVRFAAGFAATLDFEAGTAFLTVFAGVFLTEAFVFLVEMAFFAVTVLFAVDVAASLLIISPLLSKNN